MMTIQTKNRIVYMYQKKTVRTESSQQNQAERMRTKKLNSTTDMSMM